MTDFDLLEQNKRFCIIPINIDWILRHALLDECPPFNEFYQCKHSESEETTTEACANCWIAFAKYARENKVFVKSFF